MLLLRVFHENLFYNEDLGLKALFPFLFKKKEFYANKFVYKSNKNSMIINAKSYKIIYSVNYKN